MNYNPRSFLCIDIDNDTRMTPRLICSFGEADVRSALGRSCLFQPYRAPFSPKRVFPPHSVGLNSIAGANLIRQAALQSLLLLYTLHTLHTFS